MTGCVIAYDAEGNIVLVYEYQWVYDDTPDRRPIGLLDFAAHEESGAEMTDLWRVDDEDRPVKGSKAWPEWLGGAIGQFRVELEGPPGAKHISALVHKTSGYRRERRAIDEAIAKRIAAAGDGPADIRDLVGGPTMPLVLDANGRTRRRPKAKAITPGAVVRTRRRRG